MAVVILAAGTAFAITRKYARRSVFWIVSPPPGTLIARPPLFSTPTA